MRTTIIQFLLLNTIIYSYLHNYLLLMMFLTIVNNLSQKCKKIIDLF